MQRTIEPGRVVLFDHDGNLEIGIIEDSAGFKFNISLRDGSALLAISRMHPLGYFYEKKINGDSKVFLEQLWQRAFQLSKKVDVKNLHSAVEAGALISPLELAKAWQYSGEIDLAEIAIKIALSQDKLYFKRRDGGFEVKTGEAIKEALEAKAAKEHRSSMFKSFAEQLARDATSLATSSEISRELLHSLELIASSAEDSGITAEEAKELLDYCETALGRATSSSPLHLRALAILTAVGRFNDRTDLSLFRHLIPRSFTSEEQNLASNITAPSESQLERLQITAPTYTVDDESTLDMDDAISLAKTEDGFVLGIHISDVASLIQKDSILDRAAARRGTSIYTASEIINMLPSDLSESKLSLTQGEKKNCLSCLINISGDYKIIEFKFVKTSVTVTERLTYEQLDARLENGDEILEHIYQIATEHLTERIQNGSMNISKTDAFVRLIGDKLKVQLCDEEAPSRILVSELMVLYNVAAAKFCQQAGVPILYRGQEAPRGNIPKGIPEGPALDYAMRSRMRRSVTSLTPTRHAGLAVDFYTQATSPIRRYADLIVQRQLSSILSQSNPAYGANELTTINEGLTSALSSANAVSKESRRFWLLRYLLEEKYVGRMVEGVVVKIEDRYILVDVPEIYLTVLVKPGAQRPKLGATVKLTIKSIDPRSDQIRCTLF